MREMKYSNHDNGEDKHGTFEAFQKLKVTNTIRAISSNLLRKEFRVKDVIRWDVQ